MLEKIIRDQQQKLGIPSEVDIHKYPNLTAAFQQATTQFRDMPAFTSLGRTLSYGEMDSLSADFAAWLQHHTDLKPGDRVAIQLPNIIQYPVVLFGVLRAGMIVVNTNPLYSKRELVHQFNDSGAKALIVLANVAANVSEALPETGIKHVILTELGDLHSPLKRFVLNKAVKYIKKMVPPYHLPGAVKLTTALSLGRKRPAQFIEKTAEDIAVLQYTGGTTGVAKGAMLTHGNLLANTLQCSAIFEDYGFMIGREIMIQPLPLYHVYAFTVSMIAMLWGCHTVLIPNPRDLPALVKELSKWQFTGFCGLNTLFVGLSGNKDFRALDFTSLKMTMSGGMALTRSAEEAWHKLTGSPIYEGYGLTETSPVVSVNPASGNRVGTIGLPVPGTLVRILDAEGNQLSHGEPGELCVKGPQVMKGYWQRPDETEEVLHDGWFRTGDMAIMEADGYLKIVDRKKDMIIVSGFNVYPNEVEDVFSSHPGVLECAAIGVPDDKSGEAVKLFVVKKNPDLTAGQLIAYGRENLAGYKVPRYVEFREDLPKSNVGKILRRELRDT